MPLTMKARINRAYTYSSGFSLPEVITVMAIIGILSAISIPSIMSWLPNMRLKSAARDLYANMQKAKMGALKDNHEWAIFFTDPGGADDSYSICDDSVDGNWATPNHCFETVLLSDYQSGIQIGHGNAGSPKGANYGGGDSDNVSYADNRAIFNSRGTGNGGYVYLQHEGGSDSTSFAIGTNTTGSIKLYRWKGSWE